MFGMKNSRKKWRCFSSKNSLINWLEKYFWENCVTSLMDDHSVMMKPVEASCRTSWRRPRRPSSRSSSGNKVSISPTFYEKLFCKKVFCKAFSLLTFWLCNLFGSRKLLQKLLVKCWWNCDYTGDVEELPEQPRVIGDGKYRLRWRQGKYS